MLLFLILQEPCWTLLQPFQDWLSWWLTFIWTIFHPTLSPLQFLNLRIIFSSWWLAFISSSSQLRQFLTTYFWNQRSRWFNFYPKLLIEACLWFSPFASLRHKVNSFFPLFEWYNARYAHYNFLLLFVSSTQGQRYLFCIWKLQNAFPQTFARPLFHIAIVVSQSAQFRRFRWAYLGWAALRTDQSRRRSSGWKICLWESDEWSEGPQLIFLKPSRSWRNNTSFIPSCSTCEYL